MGPSVPAGGQLITTFVTYFLFLIPIIILNGIVAPRKGRSAVAFTLLSFIPLCNIILTIFLVSLPDIEMKKKVDEIHELIRKYREPLQ